MHAQACERDLSKSSIFLQRQTTKTYACFIDGIVTVTDVFIVCFISNCGDTSAGSDAARLYSKCNL